MNHYDKMFADSEIQAGTIGGKTYGVAKSVSLVAVKVLDADGAGTNSDTLAGLNFGKKVQLSDT